MLLSSVGIECQPALGPLFPVQEMGQTGPTDGSGPKVLLHSLQQEDSVLFIEILTIPIVSRMQASVVL